MTATTHVSAPLEQLVKMMDGYPCYAFVVNEDCTGAKALFRGQWSWEAVAEYLGAQPTAVVMDDERASGYVRYRLYAQVDGCPSCLAEIEVYFARGRVEKQFWCKTAQRAGALSLAA
ncbi:MAG: hypothetical protein JWM80_6407 [Cyanobacteria bacterium RYN_339]|nr:hypothetical protein [Cyanobacteria bacterium RYN_339]